MIPVNRTYAPIQALVDELRRCGMEHAVTSPGSRNAPLALTLGSTPGIRAVSVIDERAAGFVALGIAKSTRRPVAVTCTSGTAAANLMPAVVEAWEARVPLVVMTADRPPELREVGAGQAIDQVKLYGRFANWFAEVGNHEPSRATAVHFRQLGCRAYFTAAGGRPGPVHLNFPLREPLAPVSEELEASDWEGRPGGEPWTTVTEIGRPDLKSHSDLNSAHPARTAVVCGPLAPGAVEAVAELGARAGWPLLADATSGLRFGAHDRSSVIAHYDLLLRSESFAEQHRPERIVRLGDPPTSKPLRAWLETAPQLIVDPHLDWQDPTRAAAEMVRAEPEAWCRSLLAVGAPEPDPDWLASWHAADQRVQPALKEVQEPFEPHVWNAVAEAAEPESVLWVASSMPIRDVEAFMPGAEKPLTVLANRGANGIDGTVASALGAAIATGRRTYLLTGDLALIHDLGGLAAARRAGADLTIVCANNGGGGIFDFLPVAGAADAATYEEHIATPSGVDLAQVAGLAGLPHVVATPDQVASAVAQPALVEVRTDRDASVRLHRELYDRLAGQL